MLYHLKLDKPQIENAKIAILPGDPGRVALISDFLSRPRRLTSNREWSSALGFIQSVPILVVSTGVGGPSTSICVDELAQLGVRTFLRVGTAGAINERVLPGDVVITTGAVRLDGASKDFAPIEYPAVADFLTTKALKEAAIQVGVRHHIGITVSTDTFYQAQERYSGYSTFLLPKYQHSLERWRALNALNYEMESSTLLTMCAALGLNAGCVTGAIVSRVKEENIDPTVLDSAQKRASEVAVRAAEILVFDPA